MNNLLTPSCRMAFSALIHDIGKFAERAKIDISSAEKEKNTHIYCPYNQKGRYHTHIHAAYTGVAIDLIEKYLPAINNTDTFPFQTDDKDNSIINAAAKHHRPDTYLQYIISTADRLSSAFERTKYEEYNGIADSENYQQARLIPLFEKLFAADNKNDFKYRYPIQILSAESIFPVAKQNITEEQAEQEYKNLWNCFMQDIIKTGHRDNWNLWLDSFDTLYSVYTQNIPSSSYKTLADVSLYDHSKSTAALATALWRYHYEMHTETKEAVNEDKKNKFLLIQGDVSGIQNFIFEAGKNTRKKAYKLLRGRSFMISLFSECAALKIMDTLGLPSTSQIMNAAGKFVIVAPNTPETVKAVTELKQQFSDWFKKEYYGLITVGIATVEASQSDFENKNFYLLQERIYQSLSTIKMQKFDLCNKKTDFTDFFEEYSDNKGICCFDGKMPAQEADGDTDDGYVCRRCADILTIGECLTRQNRIYISRAPIDNGLQTDILGFYVGWQKTSDTVRIWDISLPKPNDESLFNGVARRYINAYIPRFCDDDLQRAIYKNDETVKLDQPKTFSHLALENCTVKDGKSVTKPALMCVKGDIDNLGLILQSGIKNTTFATMSGLSRQINNFFAIWLPSECLSESKAKNIYTVFAGGDDFYLIGPWLDMVEILPKIRRCFENYVCHNQRITFSVGMCMTRSGDDVVSMSSMAEDALDKAKKREIANETVKNAVCCFGQVVSYEEYSDLLQKADKLDEFYQRYNLSVGYIYGLLALCRDAAMVKENFTSAMWRSKLVYRTQRFVETNKDIDKDEKEQIASIITQHIGEAIEKYQEKYIMTLSIWLYQHREN